MFSHYKLSNALRGRWAGRLTGGFSATTAGINVAGRGRAIGLGVRNLYHTLRHNKTLILASLRRELCLPRRPARYPGWGNVTYNRQLPPVYNLSSIAAARVRNYCCNWMSTVPIVGLNLANCINKCFVQRINRIIFLACTSIRLFVMY